MMLDITLSFLLFLHMSLISSSPLSFAADIFLHAFADIYFIITRLPLSFIFSLSDFR